MSLGKITCLKLEINLSFRTLKSSQKTTESQFFFESNGKSPQSFILLCVCRGSSFNGVKDLLFQMINRYFFDF
jgi:hypothetical protein